jgi:hypothetical protein
VRGLPILIAALHAIINFYSGTERSFKEVRKKAAFGGAYLGIELDRKHYYGGAQAERLSGARAISPKGGPRTMTAPLSPGRRDVGHRPNTTTIIGEGQATAFILARGTETATPAPSLRCAINEFSETH